MAVYCIDIDGTICTTTKSDYEHSKPIEEVISRINYLYDEGHIIKIYTGRGSTSGINWYKFTQEQLKSWRVKYHELIFGKPAADFYIDDKGVNIKQWLNTN